MKAAGETDWSQRHREIRSMFQKPEPLFLRINHPPHCYCQNRQTHFFFLNFRLCDQEEEKQPKQSPPLSFLHLTWKPKRMQQQSKTQSNNTVFFHPSHPATGINTMWGAQACGDNELQGMSEPGNAWVTMRQERDTELQASPPHLSAA